MNHSHPLTARAQSGATLLEVLISMLILGIGLLGLAGLQATAQQAELDSYQRSQALILAQDMVNRISSNRRAARCYLTNSTTADGYVGQGSTAAASTGCGVSDTRARADADLAQWTALLNGATEQLDGANVGAMTGARGCVQEDLAAGDTFTVIVAWQGQNPTIEPADTCAAGQFGDDKQRRTVALSIRSL